MPNYITHALCANDALQNFLFKDLKEVIQKNAQVYSMGSSGPDFIFYFRTFPWEDQSLNKEIHNIGQVIHTQKINEFYQRAVELILEEENAIDRDIKIAFLAGHLMHYALDTSAHPYVFYHSGEMKNETKYWHFRLESMIDTVMVKKIKDLSLSQIDAISMIDSSAEIRKVLSTFYAKVVKDVHSLDFSTSIYEECFATMPKVAKWLFDPHTLKFHWVQAWERASNKDWVFSSHMVIGKIDKKHDVLNLKHQAWNHPCFLHETSTESFVDLYEKAILRGQAILYALADVLYKKGSMDKLLTIIGDLSYDTGKVNAPSMQFYGSIYENI